MADIDGNEGNVEEPVVEEEEEEDYPDNTTNRDDILNSEATSYDDWIQQITSNSLLLTLQIMIHHRMRRYFSHCL